MSYSLQLEQVLHSNRIAINSLAKRYGVRNIRVFGSVVRGEAGTDSDIDLLVDMEPGRSLFDLGGVPDGDADTVGSPGGCSDRESSALVYPGAGYPGSGNYIGDSRKLSWSQTGD